MAKVKIQGNASGTGVLTVTAPNTSTDRTITLPDSTGTLLNSDGDGSSLTGVGVAGITSSADATAITIDSSERVGIGAAPASGIALTISKDGTGADLAGIRLIDSNSGNDQQIYNYQGNLYFRDSTAGVTRLRVDADGLKFGNDTAAATALDDYEEGTYTPVFKDTSNASMTGSLHSCLYTKVGRLVHVMVYYSVGDSQNGNLSTMTLPFNQTGSGRGAGSITTYACPNANKGNEIYLNGGSKVAFWQVRDNATSIPMAVDNGSELILSITYMTA